MCAGMKTDRHSLVTHTVMAVVATLLLFVCRIAFAQSTKATTWSFAVSGDSRNCGDVVMPAIAEGVKRDRAEFYWHLGDYRAIYNFDEDYRQTHPTATIEDYEDGAWQDFIEHQLMPFEKLPVYLGLGNHETIPPKTRSEAIQVFADWFDAPAIREQRLADDAKNHKVQTYDHWIRGQVDFITLDNSSDDMFDADQAKWFEDELKRAAANSSVRSVVVGMHRALPDSFSTGHSMNDTPQETASGRRVYKDLLNFRDSSHKKVYVLASHSHFSMANVYNTRCRREHPETILPGWIVGTAGAVRYQLPKDVEGAEFSQNDLYGYLLGTVQEDGAIQFQFKPVAKELSAIPDAVRKEFTDSFVQQCLEKNHSSYQPDGPPQPPQCPE
jgi:Calcineurin-like phosphoesterase